MLLVNVISITAIYTNNKVIQKWVTYPFISSYQPSYIWTTVVLYSMCNESHARWGRLMHTHCVPCVMNSMYEGLHAYRVLVRRVTCLPGSRVPGSMLTRFHLLPVLVWWIPWLPGSSYVGFHVYQAPWLPGSIYSGFFCASFLHSGFHLLWTPCMPDSNHARLQSRRVLCVMNSCVFYFYVLWTPCLADSMHAGFYVLWIPCMPGYKYMLLVNVISIAGHIY